MVIDDCCDQQHNSRQTLNSVGLGVFFMYTKKQLKRRAKAQKRYREKLRSLGLLREYSKRSRPKNRVRKKRTEESSKWRRKPENKRKKYCHQKVWQAIKRGIIKQQACEICSSFPAHAHHEDYSKPLDVIWLCPQHHMDRHIKLSRAR